MGEAKRRGKFEHRKAEEIAREEEERHRFLIAHKPSKKNAVALVAILIATGAVIEV